MNFTACGRTDKGLSRPNNEDRYLIAENPALFMVADGMGGHAAGEIASQIAIEATFDQIKNARNYLEEPFLDNGFSSPSAKQRLAAIIKRTNQVIQQAALNNLSWRGMGTTIAVAWPISQNRLVYGHVGDSRIYHLRDGELQQLTRDHTMLEEQIELGLITKEEGAQSRIKNILTRALGHEVDVEVDVNEMSLLPDDRLILCSDGLTTMLTDETILSVVMAQKEFSGVCDELVNAANRKGGKDNITVIVARCNVQ